ARVVAQTRAVAAAPAVAATRVVAAVAAMPARPARADPPVGGTAVPPGREAPAAISRAAPSPTRWPATWRAVVAPARRHQVRRLAAWGSSSFYSSRSCYDVAAAWRVPTTPPPPRDHEDISRLPFVSGL